MNAVEAKDTWTRDHSENVTRYALKIADRMGLSDRQREILRYGGVLHDIGKIVISSEITDKPGGLSEEECRRAALALGARFRWRPYDRVGRIDGT